MSFTPPKRPRPSDLDDDEGDLPHKHARRPTRLVVVISPHPLQEQADLCHAIRWEHENKPTHISLLRVPEEAAEIEITVLRPRGVLGLSLGSASDKSTHSLLPADAKTTFVVTEQLTPRMCAPILNFLLGENSDFIISREETRSGLQQLQGVILQTDEAQSRAAEFVKGIAMQAELTRTMEPAARSEWLGFVMDLFKIAAAGNRFQWSLEEAKLLVQVVGNCAQPPEGLPCTAFLTSLLVRLARGKAFRELPLVDVPRQCSSWSDEKFQSLLTRLPGEVFQEHRNWSAMLIRLCPSTASSIVFLRNQSDYPIDDLMNVHYPFLVSQSDQVSALMGTTESWLQWWHTRLLQYFQAETEANPKEVCPLILSYQRTLSEVSWELSSAALVHFFSQALRWALRLDYQSATGSLGERDPGTMGSTLVQMCLLLNDPPMDQENRVAVINKASMDFLCAEENTHEHVRPFFLRLCHLAHRYAELSEFLYDVTCAFPDEVKELLAPHLLVIPYPMLARIPQSSQSQLQEFLVTLYYELKEEDNARATFLQSIPPPANDRVGEFLRNLFDCMFLRFHTDNPLQLLPAELDLLHDARFLSTDTFISSELARNLSNKFVAGALLLDTVQQLFPSGSQPPLQFMVYPPLRSEDEVRERLRQVWTLIQQYKRLQTLQREMGLAPMEESVTMNDAEIELMDASTNYQTVLVHPFRRVIAHRVRAILAHIPNHTNEDTERALGLVITKLPEYQNNPLEYPSMAFLTNDFTTYTQEEYISLLRDHCNVELDATVLQMIANTFQYHSLVELSPGLVVLFRFAEIMDCKLHKFLQTLPANPGAPVTRDVLPEYSGDFDLVPQAFDFFHWLALSHADILTAQSVRPAGASTAFLRGLPTLFQHLRDSNSEDIQDDIQKLNFVLQESAFDHAFRSCRNEVAELRLYPSTSTVFHLNSQSDFAMFQALSEGHALVSAEMDEHGVVPVNKWPTIANTEVSLQTWEVLERKPPQDMPFPWAMLTAKEFAQIRMARPDEVPGILYQHIPAHLVQITPGEQDIRNRITVRYSRKEERTHTLECIVHTGTETSLPEILPCIVHLLVHPSQLIVVDRGTTWEYLLAHINRMYLPELKWIYVVGLELLKPSVCASLIDYLEVERQGPHRAALHFVVSENFYASRLAPRVPMNKLPLQFGALKRSPRPAHFVSSQGKPGLGKTEFLHNHGQLASNAIELGGQLQPSTFAAYISQVVAQFQRDQELHISLHPFTPGPDESPEELAYRVDAFLFRFFHFGYVETQWGLFYLDEKLRKQRVAVELHMPISPRILLDVFEWEEIKCPYVPVGFFTPRIPQAPIHRYLRHHPMIDRQEITADGRVTDELCQLYISEKPFQSWTHVHRFFQLACAYFEAHVALNGDAILSEPAHEALAAYCVERASHGPHRPQQGIFLMITDWPLVRRWQQACVDAGYSLEEGQMLWHVCEFLLCRRPLILTPTQEGHVDFSTLLKALHSFLGLERPPVRCALTPFSRVGDMEVALRQAITIPEYAISPGPLNYNRLLVFERIEHAPALWPHLYEMMYRGTLYGVRIPASLYVMATTSDNKPIPFPTLVEATLYVPGQCHYTLVNKFAQGCFNILAGTVASRATDLNHFSQIYDALGHVDSTNIPLTDLRRYLKESGQFAKDYLLIAGMLVFHDRLSVRDLCQQLSTCTFQPTAQLERRWNEILRYVSTIFHAYLPAALQDAHFLLRILLVLMLNTPLCLIGPSGTGKSLACHVLKRFYQSHPRRHFVVSHGRMGSSPQEIWRMISESMRRASPRLPVTFVLDDLTKDEYAQLLPLLDDRQSDFTLLFISGDVEHADSSPHILQYHSALASAEVRTTMQSTLAHAATDNSAHLNSVTAQVMEGGSGYSLRDLLATALFYHSWPLGAPSAQDDDMSDAHATQNPFQLSGLSFEVQRTLRGLPPASSIRYCALLSNTPPIIQENPGGPTIHTYDCAVEDHGHVIRQVISHAGQPVCVYLLNLPAGNSILDTLRNLLESKTWDSSFFALSYRFIPYHHVRHHDFQIYFHFTPEVWEGLSPSTTSLLQPIRLHEVADPGQLQEALNTWLSALTATRMGLTPTHTLLDDIQPQMDREQLFVTQECHFTLDEQMVDSSAQLARDLFLLRMHVNAFLLIPLSSLSVSYEDVQLLYHRYFEERTLPALLQWRGGATGSCYECLSRQRETVVFTFSPLDTIEQVLNQTGKLAEWDSLDTESQVLELHQTGKLAVADCSQHQAQLLRFIEMHNANPVARVLVIRLRDMEEWHQWMDRPSFKEWNQVLIEDLVQPPPFPVSDSLTPFYQSLSPAQWTQLLDKALEDQEEARQVWEECRNSLCEDRSPWQWLAGIIGDWEREQQDPCHWMYELSHSRTLQPLPWRVAQPLYLARAIPPALRYLSTQLEKNGRQILTASQ